LLRRCHIDGTAILPANSRSNRSATAVDDQVGAHNRLVAGLSRTSPTTQSCANPVSRGLRKSRWFSATFARARAAFLVSVAGEVELRGQKVPPVSGSRKPFPGRFYPHRQRRVRMSTETGFPEVAVTRIIELVKTRISPFKTMKFLRYRSKPLTWLVHRFRPSATPRARAFSWLNAS
jgi:hypothetical protein